VVIISLGAVNKLLLGKRGEFTTVFDHGVSLESTNSREGPAASTVTLILDWRDSAMVLPVPVGWDISLWFGDRHLLSGSRAVLWVLKAILDVVVLVELSLSHVRELIDSLLPGVGWV